MNGLPEKEDGSTVSKKTKGTSLFQLLKQYFTKDKTDYQALTELYVRALKFEDMSLKRKLKEASTLETSKRQNISHLSEEELSSSNEDHTLSESVSESLPYYSFSTDSSYYGFTSPVAPQYSISNVTSASGKLTSPSTLARITPVKAARFDSSESLTRPPRLTSRPVSRNGKYPSFASSPEVEDCTKVSPLRKENCPRFKFKDYSLSRGERSRSFSSKKELKSVISIPRESSRDNRDCTVTVPKLGKSKHELSGLEAIKENYELELGDKYSTVDTSLESPNFINVGGKTWTCTKKPVKIEDYDADSGQGVSSFDDSQSEDKFIYASSGSGIIDSHCHLDFLFNRIRHRGRYQKFIDDNISDYTEYYEGCITIFCNPVTWPKHYFWRPIIKHKRVWGAFGCHPHHAWEYSETFEKILICIMKDDDINVVALGEIGLDYSHKNNCERNIQKDTFRRQIDIALKYKKPLIIHSRDSNEDSLAIMKEKVPKNWLIHRHCHTGKYSEIKPWLDYFTNCYIGYTNVITYDDAVDVRDSVYLTPLDRILLETDAPYFVPKHLRDSAKHAHPGMIYCVAEKIAAVKKLKFIDVVKTTRKNTKNMYGV